MVSRYEKIENQPERLLYPRKITAAVLGGVSLRKIKELEAAGWLTRVRLGRSATGQVFHRASQVRALAEGDSR